MVQTGRTSDRLDRERLRHCNGGQEAGKGRIIFGKLVDRRQRPETRDQRPEIRDQRSETRDQRPETRNQRSETRDQRPETRDERSGQWSEDDIGADGLIVRRGQVIMRKGQWTMDRGRQKGDTGAGTVVKKVVEKSRKVARG